MPRSAIAGRDNPLVVGPVNFQHVAELDRVGEALAAKLATHPLGEEWCVPCPPHLRETLEIGERLWNELELLGADRDPERVAEFMLELFCAEATQSSHDGHVGSRPHVSRAAASRV